MTAKRQCSVMGLSNSSNDARWKQVFNLSIKDLCHDWRVSSTLILSIVSVLAPLLLLFGLKTGVVETFKESLLSDPRNLEVIIVENTRLSKDWFDELRAETELVRFVIPRTRTLNMMIDVQNQDNYLLKRVELVPTGSGDPLLPVDLLPPENLKDVLLTHAAASQLATEKGSTIKVWLKRKLDGINQSVVLHLNVIGIVPESTFARPALFVTLNFLEAYEDYRMGIAAPLLHVNQLSENPPTLMHRMDDTEQLESHSRETIQTPADDLLDGKMSTPTKPEVLQGKTRTEPRTSYASARLYAQRPEDVTKLADSLRTSGIEVRTRGEDIARLQAIEHLLGRIMGLIVIVALIGGCLTFGGVNWISIERKRTALASLRLIGLSGNQVIMFCLNQAVILSFLAFLTSYLLYLLGAEILNHYGSGLYLTLLKTDAVDILLCQLHLEEGLIVAISTFLFTLFTSLLGAVHAKSFQPAECLREA